MASYHDPYDSRPRPSRKHDHDPSSRARDGGYPCLEPTAGANEPRRRSGETTSATKDGYYNRQRSSAYDRYDSRYDYPPPPPPDHGRPARRPTPRTPKRYSWPPPPTVESAVTAFAKEAGSDILISELSKEDEVPSRGTIDQDPVLQDVPELINKDERRFVLRPREPRQQPSPPTSEDEKMRRRMKRRPSTSRDLPRVDANEAIVPELGKRAAAPYGFSQPDRKPQVEMPATRVASPEELLCPRPSDSNSQKPTAGSRSQPPSPRRDSARYSMHRNDYFPPGNEHVVTDDESDGISRQAKGKSATLPSSRDSPRSSRETSVTDFASQSRPASIRRTHLDARRNTDSDGTLPTLQRLSVDKTWRPAPLMTGNALSGLNVPVASSPQTTLSSDYPRPRSRDGSYVSSKGPSPAGSTVGGSDPTPPRRSPRMGAEVSHDDVYDRPPTRESSTASSRPQSPSPRTPNDSPRLPKTELDWSTLLAANASRRSVPPSRLSTYMQQESTPPPSRGHMRQSVATRVETLPYPVDDGPATPVVSMPSERKHQYYPSSQPSQRMPEYNKHSGTASPVVPAGTYPSPSSTNTTRPARPPFPSRYSTADLPDLSKQQQSEKERPRANEGRRTAVMPSSQTRKDLQDLAKRELPICSRAKPVQGHTDWYTLVDAPTLYFCPDCISEVFDQTIYLNHFRRSPRRSADDHIRCALGGKPWIRLGWLMTLQQERLDLKLLEDLAEVEETSTPCAGDDLVSRTWYGLRDKNGIFVKDFRICYNDVRNIEALLPTLKGVFVRLPQRTADEVGMCSIRPEGSRFSIYIDALILAHERASVTRSPPDLGPFITLVQWRSRLRECTKDALIYNGLWHFIPSLPELTVCEDCFATVVEPEVEKGNEIALRFNRTIQPVYSEGIGSSCQLYSPRMRKVFDRAVRNKDFKYLARKATERREAELRLQRKYKSVVERAKRVSWGSESGAEDERRLEREIEKITREWKEEWE